MCASETGKLITAHVLKEYDLIESTHAYGDIPAAPSTPPPEKENVAVLPSVSRPMTPEHQSSFTMSSFGLYTPARTPSQKIAQKVKRTREPQSPSISQQTQDVVKPTSPAIAPSTATGLKPQPTTADATASGALPTSAVKNRSNTLEAPPIPSLASRPTTPTANTTISTGALPIPVESPYTPCAFSSAFNPVTQLAATRRPAAVLTAVSEALTTEIAALERLDASIAEIKRLMAAKEEEQAAQLRKIDTYRDAIEDALNAIETQQSALRNLRAQLASFPQPRSCHHHTYGQRLGGQRLGAEL